jgi:ABC-type amino acid transport substrate-binding protein
VVDTRVTSSGDAMMNDLVSGEIDAGVLWGPIAGYRASRADVPMNVQLLLKDTGGPRMIYRITMGVRPSDQNWKRQLNTLIAQNHEAIDKVLLDFGVPLLNADDQPMTGEAAAPKQ